MAATSKEEKIQLRFDPNKGYIRDHACLGCHTSGYGLPAGYVVLAAGDTKAQEQGSDNASDPGKDP